MLSTATIQDSWVSSAADCSHSKKDVVAWTAGPFASCLEGLLSFFQVTNESSVMTSSSYNVCVEHIKFEEQTALLVQDHDCYPGICVKYFFFLSIF